MNLIRVFVCLALIASAGIGVSGCSKGDGASDSDGAQGQDVFLAAATGNVARLKELITADPSLVDAYGPEGKAPLHDAAAAGQNAAVKFLLEQGADPTVTDEAGNTAVNAAFAQHHPDTAKIIQDAIAAKGGAPAQ